MQVNVLNLPVNLVFGANNLPATVATDTGDASVILSARNNVVPGVYTIVVRAQMQVPFSKDGKGPKTNVNVVQPSPPITVKVVARQK
jgi:hypothetical protein